MKKKNAPSPPDQVKLALAKVFKLRSGGGFQGPTYTEFQIKRRMYGVLYLCGANDPFREGGER